MYVSAVIPTYNRARYLARAVRSVLGQSLGDLELIVVDDGSRDNTRQMLENISDSRLRYIHQENKGVAAARNAGMRRARGEYVAFLDSDDWWLRDKLEKQTRFMRETGLKISQTQEGWIRGDREVAPGIRHQKYAGWIFERSLKLCLISPSCVMWDRELIDQGYFFHEDFPACEDYEMWLRITLDYPVGLLPRCLTRKHGGRRDQLSRQIIGLDLFRIYAMLELLEKRELPGDKKKRVLSVLQYKAGIYVSGCLKRGRMEEAWRVKKLVSPWVSGLTS